MSQLTQLVAEMPSPLPVEEHEEPGDIAAAIKRTSGKFVPVDSASLLIVDPCHLPAGLLESLTKPNKYGVTLAVVVATMADGAYWVEEIAEGEFSVRQD